MRSKHDDGSPVVWIPVSENVPDTSRVVYVKGVSGRKKKPYTGEATYSPRAPHWESAKRGEGGSYYVGVVYWAETEGDR